MNFTSRLHVKRRSAAYDARGNRRNEDEDVLRDEAKKPEGRLIRFYSPVASREFASDQKNVTCVRQSQAKSDAALRSSGNSKEIYVPPRVLAVVRQAGRHSMAAREKHAIAKSIRFAIGRTCRGTSITILVRHLNFKHALLWIFLPLKRVDTRVEIGHFFLTLRYERLTLKDINL